MKQIFPFRFSSVPGSSTRFNVILVHGGGGTWVGTNDSNVRQMLRDSGNLKKLKMTLSTAPGAGASRVFTITKNGSDTGLTVTFSDSDVTKTIETDVAFSDGDQIGIKHTFTGSPTAYTALYGYLVVDSTTTGASTITGITNPVSTSGTVYLVPNGGGSFSTEAEAHNYISATGTIKSLKVKLSAAPGSGKSRTFTLYKNGSSTAQTVTISDTATEATDSSHQVSVTTGDTISLESVATSTPAASNAMYGFEFIATTNGESMVFMKTISNANTTVDNFMIPSGATGTNWTATESAVQQMIDECVVRNLVAKCNRTLTSTQEYVITLRDDGADTALTVTLNSTNNYKENTGTDVNVAEGSLISIESDPNNSPGTMLGYFHGFTIYINPGGATEEDKIHNINSLLYKRNTITHSTNSLLKATNTKTHTIDSFLLNRETDNYSVDSLLQKINSSDYSIDSLLLKIVSDVSNIDSLLKERNISEYSTDTFLFERIDITHSLNSLLLKLQSAQHSIDSLLFSAETNDSEHNIDSLLKKRIEIQHSIDALLKHINTSVYSLDSLLFNRESDIYSVDSFLQQANAVVYSIDSLIQAVQDTSHTLDSYSVNREVIEHSLDSILVHRNQLIHSLDGLIKKRDTISSSLDSFISVQKESVSFDLDVLIRKKVVCVSTIQSFLFKPRSYPYSRKSSSYTDKEMVFSRKTIPYQDITKC